MKLNYDCLRKLLLVLEENIVMQDDLLYPDLRFEEVIPLMPDYSKADIAYTTSIAIEAELIDARILNADDRFYGCVYFGLTYEGHQFIDNIRNNNVWNKTKGILSKIGGASLDMISSTALKLLKSLIEAQL